MDKWDTIQADVADMYIGKVENEAYYSANDDEDFFGFAKSIELDHLSDSDLDLVADILKDFN